MDGYGNEAMMMDVDMSKDMEIKITEVRRHGCGGCAIAA